MKKRILIIKLGALGDMVQASAAFSVLREHHSADHLTLLTTKPYEEFANRLGSFDEVWLDERPKLHQLKSIFSLRTRLREGAFERVYDLQGVDRTRFYSYLIGKGVEWIAPSEQQRRIHPQERYLSQLSLVGINNIPRFDLGHLAEPFGETCLKKPYALLIPGASLAHGGRKKWPEAKYAALAAELIKKGIQPVIIGGKGDNFPLIQEKAQGSVDLTGRTTIYQIIGLAKEACFAVGNDTGPMLLAASAGCLTLTLYSDRNPPTVGGARGERYHALHMPNLNDLDIEKVLEKLSTFYPL